MQIARKRLSALALAICLLVALTCGGQIAMADGGFPPAGSNTLKVAAINTADESLKADITKANVVVDVYKVADAVPDETFARYQYILVEPFGTGQIDYDDFDADKWMELADAAAKLVTASTPYQTIAANDASTLTLPGDGLYLLLPHGKDVKLDYGEKVADSLTAKGAVYNYSFLPSFIVAPTKEPGPDGTIHTDTGDWMRDIDVALKPEYEKPTPPPEPPSDKVKTGDNTELLPYYIAMAVSGVLLAMIAVTAFRRRRANKADRPGRGDA